MFFTKGCGPERGQSHQQGKLVNGSKMTGEKAAGGGRREGEGGKWGGKGKTKGGGPRRDRRGERTWIRVRGTYHR